MKLSTWTKIYVVVAQLMFVGSRVGRGELENKCGSRPLFANQKRARELPAIERFGEGIAKICRATPFG
jgi:hypothetical protein